MADLQRRQGVALQECEGRAGHRDSLARQRLDHGTGELALASAKVAHQQDNAPGRQLAGDTGGQGACGAEVGQEQVVLGLLHPVSAQ